MDELFDCYSKGDMCDDDDCCVDCSDSGVYSSETDSDGDSSDFFRARILSAGDNIIHPNSSYRSSTPGAFIHHICVDETSDSEEEPLPSECYSLPYNPPSPIDVNIYNDYYDTNSILCKNIVYPNKITKNNKNLIHRVGDFLKQAFSFTRSKATTANKVTQTYSSDKESLISFRKGLVLSNQAQMNSKFFSNKKNQKSTQKIKIFIYYGL